jgi:hypothetical protein
LHANRETKTSPYLPGAFEKTFDSARRVSKRAREVYFYVIRSEHGLNKSGKPVSEGWFPAIEASIS